MRGWTCMSRRQAVVRAINSSNAAAETAAELRSTRTGEEPIPTGGLPLPTFENFLVRRILAWHLRDCARFESFEEATSFDGVVLLVGREHDQEEAIFRRESEARNIEDRMIG